MVSYCFTNIIEYDTIGEGLQLSHLHRMGKYEECVWKLSRDNVWLDGDPLWNCGSLMTSE